MNLLYLAPDIQEEIFFLPPVTEGRPTVTKRHLRQVLKSEVTRAPAASGRFSGTRPGPRAQPAQRARRESPVPE
jgi:hypothetical protein